MKLKLSKGQSNNRLGKFAYLRFRIITSLALILSVSNIQVATADVLFNFNPSWDSTVISNQKFETKYGLANPDSPISMVIAYPELMKTTDYCTKVTFYVAPVDFTNPGQPASEFYKKYATFAVEIWSNDGVKLASINSRDTGSANFFAPTPITQVPLQVCDPNLKPGNTGKYSLRFKAGIAVISQGEIRESQGSLSITYEKPIASSSGTKSTITCIKGKLIKKVMGINPKCPSGYKKK